MRPSERHLRDVKRLTHFHQAFAEVMKHVTYVQTGLTVGELRPTPGQEADFRDAFSRCATAAGVAADANERHGGKILTGGVGPQLVVDPVRSWKIVLEQPWRVAPEDVSGCVQGAIGAATAAAEDARDRERGLVGLVARFVRIPVDVREAVGSGHLLGAAAYGTGVLVQVLIAGVGGVLTLLLWLAGSAAWHSLT